MQGGELPLFVPDAIVEHVIPLALMGCLRKDIRSVYLVAIYCLDERGSTSSSSATSGFPPADLACLIHIFEDNKGLLCYKHVD